MVWLSTGLQNNSEKRLPFRHLERLPLSNQIIFIYTFLAQFTTQPVTLNIHTQINSFFPDHTMHEAEEDETPVTSSCTLMITLT